MLHIPAQKLPDRSTEWKEFLRLTKDAINRFKRLDCITGNTGQCITQPTPCTYIQCQKGITATCDSFNCESILAAGTPPPTAINSALQTIYISLGVGLFVMIVIIFIYWCYRRNREFRDRRRAAAYGMSSVAELRQKITSEKGETSLSEDFVSCKLVHDDPKMWGEQSHDIENDPQVFEYAGVKAKKFNVSQSDSAIPRSTFRRAQLMRTFSEAKSPGFIASDSVIPQRLFLMGENAPTTTDLTEDMQIALITRSVSQSSSRRKQVRNTWSRNSELNGEVDNAKRRTPSKRFEHFEMRRNSGAGPEDNIRVLESISMNEDCRDQPNKKSLPSRSSSQNSVAKDDRAKHTADVLSREPSSAHLPSVASNHEANLKSYLEVADIFRKQGRPDDALREYGRALQVHVDAFGEAHRSVLDIRMAIAALHFEQHRYDEAIAAYKVIKSLACRSQDAQESSIGSLYAAIGDVLSEMGYHDEAVKTYREARSMFERDVEHHIPDLEDLSMKLGKEYESLCKYKKSVKEFSVVLRSRSKRLGETAIEVLEIRRILASAFEKMGNTDEALRENLFVLESYSQTYGEDHLKVIDIRTIIGIIYLKNKRFLDAIVEFKRVLNIEIKLLGNVHTSVALTQKKLGDAYKAIGMLEQAEQSYLQCSNILADHAKDPKYLEDLVMSEDNLGDVYLLHGKNNDALTKFHSVISLARRLSSNRDMKLAHLLHKTASLCLNMELLEMTLSYCQELLKIQIVLFGAASENVADTRFMIGTAYLKWVGYGPARIDQAMPELRQALKIKLQLFGTEHACTVPIRNYLAEALMAKGHFEEAALEAKEALRILIARTYPNSHKDPSVADAYARLASVYMIQKRVQEAVENIQYALQIRETAFGPDNVKVIKTRELLQKMVETLQKGGHQTCLADRTADMNGSKRVIPSISSSNLPGDHSEPTNKSAARSAAERRRFRSSNAVQGRRFEPTRHKSNQLEDH